MTRKALPVDSGERKGYFMETIQGICPIPPSEVAANTVSGNLPDKPSQEGLYGEAALTAEEIKEVYDRLPKLLVSYYNALVESLLDGDFAKRYGLPAVSSADEGSFAKVVGGVWKAVPLTLYEGEVV